MSLGEAWPMPGLVAGYHLSDLNDFSGNTHTLVDHGTITYGLPAKFGNAAILGSGNTTKYFTHGDGLVVDLSGDCSVSGWFLLQTNPATTYAHRLIDWRSTTGTGRYLLIDYGYNYNGASGYGFAVSVGSASSTNLPYTMALNTWANIILVKSGSSSYLYVNGTLVGTVSNGTASNSTNSMSIGCAVAGNAGYFWKGNIDEVVFFNIAQSSIWVRKYYRFRLFGE
jgi:hypothetical protein